MSKAGMVFGRSSAALGSWTSMVGFMINQEFVRGFQASRIAPLLAVFEPIVVIAIVVFIRGYLRGMSPQFGTSTVLFISSGIMPYYVFLRLSIRSRAVRYDAHHRWPEVTPTETLLASIVVALSLILSAMVMWFTVLWMVGIRAAVPVLPDECLLALLLFAMMGVGMGLVNAAIIRRFPVWRRIYAVPSRGFVFLSGAYYIVDLMPLKFRDVIVWNPLAHAIEWFRVGLYGDNYPAITLDRQYLVSFAIILLLIGVACHRMTIRTERVR